MLSLSLVMVWCIITSCYIAKDTGEELISIDHAFSTPISLNGGCLERTEEFERKLDKGELMFVPQRELPNIEVVSPRTRFLIEESLGGYSHEHFIVVVR